MLTGTVSSALGGLVGGWLTGLSFPWSGPSPHWMVAAAGCLVLLWSGTVWGAWARPGLTSAGLAAALAGITFTGLVLNSAGALLTLRLSVWKMALFILAVAIAPALIFLAGAAAARFIQGLPGRTPGKTIS